MQESTFTKWILQIKPKHDENKRTSSHNQSQFRIKIPEKQIIYVCITGKNIVSILFNHFSAQLHKQNHSFCAFESVKLSVCSFPSNSRLWRLRWNPQLIFLNQLSIRESACKTTEEEEEKIYPEKEQNPDFSLQLNGNGLDLCNRLCSRAFFNDP